MVTATPPLATAPTLPVPHGPLAPSHTGYSFAYALENALSILWRAMAHLSAVERRTPEPKGSFGMAYVLRDGTGYVHCSGRVSMSPLSAHQKLEQEAQLRPAQAQARAAFDLCVALLRGLPGCAQAPIQITCDGKGTHAKPSLALVVDNIAFQNGRSVQAPLLARRVDQARSLLGRLDWSGPQHLWSYADMAIERHVFSAPDAEQAALKHIVLINGDDPVSAIQRARTGHLRLPARFEEGNLMRRQMLVDALLAPHNAA